VLDMIHIGGEGKLTSLFGSIRTGKCPWKIRR
jgi:hypothetical protein